MDSLKLHQLGRAVGEVSDSTVSLDEEAEIRADLVKRLAARKKRTTSVRWLPLVAVCLGALTLLALWSSGAGWQTQQGQTISFSKDGQPTIRGQWLTAQGTAATLEFSEGSSVELQPKTRVRVNSLTPNGAELLLERGTARADFAPRDRARWLLLAGPFSVQVTGTRFELTWVPEAGSLTLKMTEGAVIVEGPTINKPRRLVAGEVLRVSLSKSATSAPSPENDNRTMTPPDKTHEPQERPSPAPTQVGEDPELKFAHASAEELLSWADEARLAGHPALAHDALLQARQKHGVRSNTAYLLGKVAADQLHDPEDAARWFELYLQEEPRGPLREQALGRLLTLGRGDQTQIQKRASAYLQDYPTGAYAALARRLLGVRELPLRTDP